MRHRERTTSLALGLVILLLATGCNRAGEATPEAPVAVRVTEVLRADLAEGVEYLGTVRSIREVRVKARVQGTVVALPFAEGHSVTVGDVVARLGAPQLDAAVERLRADADYWAERLAEDRRLHEREAIARDQLQASARAEAVARAALAEAEARRDWTVERSPVSGQVLAWEVEPGQHVLPGQPLVLLGDQGCEVRVPVTEGDLRRGIGLDTPAILDTQGAPPIRSAVSEIAPIGEGGTRSFVVKLPVPPGAARRLRNGESMGVRFVLASVEGATAVPVAAVAGRQSDPHVFLIADAIARRWEVSTGLEDQGWVAIDPAPPAGSTVAITNLEELEDGAAVFAVPDAKEWP